MQLSASFTAFPFPSLSPSLDEYFQASHRVATTDYSRPVHLLSRPKTSPITPVTQKNKSKKQTINYVQAHLIFLLSYLSLSLSLSSLSPSFLVSLLARFLLKALRRRREKRGCWTTLRVVPPADEHGDAAAHDVEPGPLFFYEAGAPAREGPRRARTRFPLSHARGSLEEGPAIAHHHPPAGAAAAIPAPLLRKLPFLVHVQLHRSPYLPFFLPPPASPLDRLIFWIRGMDLVKKEGERVCEREKLGKRKERERVQVSGSGVVLACVCVAG